MTKRPTESRGGVKGGDFVPFRLPLAGSRGGAPLWALGQRPNCSSFNLLQGKSQQGAGSEASLPVALRSRRSAPKLLFPPCCTLSRQMGATAHPGAARKSSRTRRPAAFICLIHFAQCFSFGSMSAKYARTCSGGHASFDMCGTRNAINSSSESYANSPSV